MKIYFKSVATAPKRYTFYRDSVTAHFDGFKETFDLSNFPDDGVFMGSDIIGAADVVRGAWRSNGELIVTLTQQVIAGQYPGRKAHWRESPIIDAADYDPNTCYVVPTGMQGVDDYEILQGVDVAGNTGWTVRKKEMTDG